MATNDEEMTLKELLLLVWGNRWLVLATTLGCGLVAALWVFSERPVYKVDALLQIETKKSKMGGSAIGAMADLFDVASPAETEIEVIKSRKVLSRVAENLHLDLQVTPKGWGRLARLRKVPKPTLDLKRFDVPEMLIGEPFELECLGHGEFVLRNDDLGEVLRGKVGTGSDSARNPFKVGIFVQDVKAHQGSRFVLVKQNPLDLVEGMMQAMTVAEVGKKTGVIGMSVEGYDPREAAALLNEIANVYVRQDVEQKSAEAEKTLSFLQEQLPEIKTSLEASEAKLNLYRSHMGSVDLTAEAKIALDQQVDVQQKLFEAQQKRKELQQLFKEDHPNIKTLDSVIVSLTSKLGGQERQVKALPLQQQEVVRLMRDVQVNTELYTGLLNNSQQLKVVKAGEIGNVRVIDYAFPKLKPIKPKKPMMLVAGLVAGFALGAGLVLLRRMILAGVDDPKLVEKELGLPVYSSIPHSDEQDRLYRLMHRKEKGAHLLALKAADDLAVESFRSLRTTLHFSMLDAPNRILLIVGPSPSIGKSFVCANFAATLAMAGSRVLLVDADLRRGHLHQYFGLKRGAGLSDVLSGAAKLDSCVQDTDVKGLGFLSTGMLPPNPSELLLHENFAGVLETLKAAYDYVVIDSAPVLAVTDAVILGKLAGTTLMVLKHGKHPLAEIEACQKRLSQADVALKGVVFNDVDLSSASSRVGYGTAAYQYSYKPQGK